MESKRKGGELLLGRIGGRCRAAIKGRARLHRSLVLCLAFLAAAASPVFADCAAPSTDVKFDSFWSDPRPAAVQTAADIHTWKTLTLGVYRDLPTLGVALDQAGCRIGDEVGAMLANRAFPLAPERREIELVVLSVAQLGFPRAASRAAIFARAEALGLQLCPPEVGPLLRLQYADQPVGEFLRIAMEPVRMANGGLDDMLVGNGGDGDLLVSAQARPDQTLYWNVLLVFARKAPSMPMEAQK